ncbi:hypothetical protein Avbf_03680 [Armadillidium vulgare]|nr:hypothetical protein Avbf_03680 [Armadillidium vulgare]
MCDDRPITGQDVAYKLNEQAVITLPTAHLFQDQFPEDFSIMSTIRLDQGTSSVLFGLYTDIGEDQMIIEVGDNVRLFYQDEEGKPEGGNTIIFSKSINDGNLVGENQQLDLISGPEAAYEHCNKYSPDCDQPLPTNYTQAPPTNYQMNQT